MFFIALAAVILLGLGFYLSSDLVLAEDKFSTDIIPKLTAEEEKDAPELFSGDVYPPWGVPCTNFTYHVMYKDKKNRAPEYVRINLNGEWYDMTKTKGDYRTGATYTYNIVPDSGKQLFYYYEASNGVGKARTSIIDTPDQGPLLFSEKLDNNQIILLDEQGNEVWSFDMGRDWTEGVAISKDGNYIAVVTHINIHLFSKESGTPLWTFCKQCELPPVILSNMEGIAISGDGSYVAGTMRGNLYFFERESNEPVWVANIESGAIGADMSDDGRYIAVGVGNAEGGRGQKIFLFDKEGNKLLEYKPEHPGYDQTGDFYQPDVTPDGKYISISTGCPDRRAYLFSGEGNLLFRSEQLTEDSPVHKSAISDDGSLIAYSLDHSQGKEILFLFDNKGNKLWSFSSQTDSTARAVSVSGDGNYVAIGTTTGHIYLFSKDSNKPKWDFTDFGFFSHFGDIKLNQDGSLLAAGGTTKKVYLFSKNSNKPLWEYKANTWVTKIDFNGEYIVAGTGPREYFMEGKSLSDDKVECKEIIQPPPMEESIGTMDNPEGGGEPKASYCGNGICEDWTETYENCPQDCCPPSGCVDDDFEDDIDNKRIDEDVEGFFSKIISFFKRLFRIRTNLDKEGGRESNYTVENIVIESD